MAPLSPELLFLGRGWKVILSDWMFVLSQLQDSSVSTKEIFEIPPKEFLQQIYKKHN